MIGTLFWERPESRRLEFKESWPGGDKIARTAIAFANGAGGRPVYHSGEGISAVFPGGRHIVRAPWISESQGVNRSCSRP